MLKKLWSKCKSLSYPVASEPEDASPSDQAEAEAKGSRGDPAPPKEGCTRALPWVGATGRGATGLSEPRGAVPGRGAETSVIAILKSRAKGTERVRYCDL